MIPLKYFKEKKQFGQKLDLWLKLNNVTTAETDEQIVVETDVSIYEDLNLDEFNDVIITGPSRDQG